MKKLTHEFFQIDAVTLAKSLLGKVLVHDTQEGMTSGIIVETEAYIGPEDKAAHTYNNRRTQRTEIVYHSGGCAYVYLVYGLHSCLNVTANITGKPECVLLRALEPVDGIDLMKFRRKTSRIEALCSGPGKLCSAMGITRTQNGLDLTGEELYIAEGNYRDIEIVSSPRIGIDYAGEWRDKLLRFYIDGNEYVSRRQPN